LDSLSDKALWSLIRQNNKDAFVVIYNRYWEKVYTISYWHLYDQELAKDLVQDLFVDLWDKRHKIDIAETVEGYLNTAIKNRLFNHMRSNGVHKRYRQHIQQTSDEARYSTEERSNARELKRLYHNEVQKLPDKMKEIYLLNKETGNSIAEIARHLSLSEQTVKNQLTNALKRIRTALENYTAISLLIITSIWMYF